MIPNTVLLLLIGFLAGAAFAVGAIVLALVLTTRRRWAAGKPPPVPADW